MCGIAGVLVQEGTPAVAALYEALLALQHRGQDAAGIVTEDNGRLCLHKDNGMVRDVFQQEHIGKLTGHVGIGHVRYPTAGSSCSSEAQPFYVNNPFGMTLAHNGNLVNTDALKKALRKEWRHINTGSDSEVLLNVLAAALLDSLATRAASPVMDERPTAAAATDEDLLYAARLCMSRCVGGFAVVAMITGYGLLALRDPHGIRPLVYGRKKIEAPPPTDRPPHITSAVRTVSEDPSDYEWMVASESGALNALGFELIADVPAGHCVMLRQGQWPSTHDCVPAGSMRPSIAPCLFEYVYFARPDSVLDGVSVYRTRLRMGAKLAEKIVEQWPEHDIDVVIPVPDTARTAALECAATLKVPYREGFIKNRYVGRTFIMPQQGLRRKSVRQKLAPIASELNGRNILLFDDSIVRGTTSSEIIQMAREAGARRVYIASAAPPVKYPNVYGIDMPTKSELIANGPSDDKATTPDADRKAASDAELEERVSKAIGADKVFYQKLEDLTASITDEAEACGAKGVSGLDCSCFDGVYVTAEEVSNEYLKSLAATRHEGRGISASAVHLLDRLAIPKKARVA